MPTSLGHKPMRAPKEHPIVDGRQTTFVALGELYNRDKQTMANRYRKCEPPVTHAQLRAMDIAHDKMVKRDLGICKLFAKGKGSRAIAAQLGLSQRRVQQILRENGYST